jgi:Cu(I)/Ag(I) efflux system membrane fusion protein
MQMDLDVAGLDPTSVPLDTPIEFDLAKDENGMFSIIAVRAEGEDAGPAQQRGDAPTVSAPPIVVSGTIDAIDAATGKATITHGPITEIGMPGMTMAFDLDSGLDLAGFEPGREMTLTFARPDGMTMVLAAAEPVAPTAPPIVVTGTIEGVDAATSRATITHGPIMEIGMPGMTMEFAVDADLDLASLANGMEMSLTFARPDGMTMVLTGAEPVQPPMEVSGTINAVDPDTRTANITHGPMTEIGMPGMTMDFAIATDIDPATLPTGEELTLLLHRNPDFTMTLVGTAAQRSVSQ